MPPNTIYVGRPSKWGNPYSGYPRSDGVRFFRIKAILDKLDVSDLRGKNLACWCSLDDECHADVLLELANRV
jgi:hypothetical protein